MTPRMVNETFEDINGRRWKRYTVRSLGPGRGCYILDKLLNLGLAVNQGCSREQCWEYLRNGPRNVEGKS